MKLIVGLGNPGKQYDRTRHNVGFLIVDALTKQAQITLKNTSKLKADVSKGEIMGKRVVVAKPLTYMNESGMAVQALLHFYKLTTTDLVVIHDDKDIPLGETRVQRDRGSAGHNGIKSIIEQLGTRDFLRIRVGVAPAERAIDDTADFVLGKFTKDEQKILKNVTDHVLVEIEKIIK